MDHIVLTTSQQQAFISFYEKLGFQIIDAKSHFELHAGDFKINLHIKDQELTPHASQIQTGSADFCIEVDGDLDEYKQYMESIGITI